MIYEAKFYSSAPSTKDKNAIATDRGGYSHCIVRDSSTGYTLPNCVAFVHASWLLQATAAFDVEYAKALESRLCRKNAEVYWGYTEDGFERGQAPRRGAIICWRKGKVGSSDGAGHVAVVRDVHQNGDVTVVASNYSGAKYYVATYRRDKDYYLGKTYAFQGFIYLPFIVDDFVTIPTQQNLKNDQVNVTISNLNVRTEHSIKAHRQGYCKPGWYDVLEVAKQPDYTWYRITDELWIAQVSGVEFHAGVALPEPVARNNRVPQVFNGEKYLNVRTGPTKDAQSIGFCPIGIYDILERDTDNSGALWFRISEGLWICKVDKVEELPEVEWRVTVSPIPNNEIDWALDQIRRLGYPAEAEAIE